MGETKSAFGPGLAAKGDPEISVRAPVPELTENTEIVLEASLAAKSKSPALVMVRKEGDIPVGVRGRTSERAPELGSICSNEMSFRAGFST